MERTAGRLAAADYLATQVDLFALKHLPGLASESDAVNDDHKADVQVFFRYDPRYGRLKRCFDLLISLASLPIAIPMTVFGALAIWLEDRHNPFFLQERVGMYGRLFHIYKLRTMKVEACENAISPTSRHDGRVTRVGSLLRRTSIDELPQIINVIRGEMAIVGPRPEMPFLVRRYEPWQHCRHLVKPGITGLWQSTVRKQIALHNPEATKIDLQYIRKASMQTDTKILFNTFLSICGTSGAF